MYSFDVKEYNIINCNYIDNSSIVSLIIFIVLWLSKSAAIKACIHLMLLMNLKVMKIYSFNKRVITKNQKLYILK